MEPSIHQNPQVRGASWRIRGSSQGCLGSRFLPLLLLCCPPHGQRQLSNPITAVLPVWRDKRARKWPHLPSKYQIWVGVAHLLSSHIPFDRTIMWPYTAAKEPGRCSFLSGQVEAIEAGAGKYWQEGRFTRGLDLEVFPSLALNLLLFFS